MLRDSSSFPIQVGGLAPGDSTTTVNLSNATNISSQLKPHCIYRIYSSVDCFIKRGDGSVTATLTDCPLKGGADYTVITQGDNNLFLAGIVSGGTGVLFITEWMA
jgi:hypothetical protein